MFRKGGHGGETVEEASLPICLPRVLIFLTSLNIEADMSVK